MKKNSGTKAALRYAANGTTIGLIYEALKDDTDNSPLTRNAYYAAVSQKIGKETIKVAYGIAEDGKNENTKTGANWMAAGIAHSYSSRTTIYLMYAATKNEADATYGLGQGQGGAFKPGKGEDPSVVALGLNYNF